MKSVRPKKNLGQHFLTDLSIARRIADTVDACPDLPVLEIGPGMGVLTQYLVTKDREVKAVEIDSESVAYLHANFPKLRDNIIGDDFLRMDLNEIFAGHQFVLTGNYPYDISSQIFFKMLDYKDLIPCCTGMIQRVLGVRIAGRRRRRLREAPGMASDCDAGGCWSGDGYDLRVNRAVLCRARDGVRHCGGRNP